MKKFFFRLETLLKVRKAKEGRIQRELAYVQQKWTQLKEKEESVERQMTSLIEAIRKKREQKEHGLEETYSQLLDHLKMTLSQTQEALALQSKQVEEKQSQLKQAIKERKVIEKIKEKHYAGWRVQAAQSEGALSDEITLQQQNSE